MVDDPIVEEIRAIREAIFAEHDYDLRKLGRALQESQKQHGDKLVTLPPRRIKPASPLTTAPGIAVPEAPPLPHPLQSRS
jgi:hypothetical protein